MGLEGIVYEDGQTPLDEDERDGLLPDTVTTKGELDEVEQENIQKAMHWTQTRRRKFTIDEVFTEEFICNLHKKMYADVWKWAGEFRHTNKNIGVDKYQIAVLLRALLDDCKYWIEHETYPPDEIAIRFSHRIVAIHCFPNGNGRHSRLIADIIAEKLLDRPVFTWGGNKLTQPGDIRTTYLQAIRTADAGDFAPLLAFSRS